MYVGDWDIYVECGVPSSHWLINYERKGKKSDYEGLNQRICSLLSFGEPFNLYLRIEGYYYET